MAVLMFSAPATTRTPSASATTAGEPGPPEAAASQVTGARAAARYCGIDSRGGGSRRWLISSHAYVTATTDEAAAAPDAHAGTCAPHASASMPARARTHEATAVRLIQIRVLTTRKLFGGCLLDRRVCDSRCRHCGTESVVDVDDRYSSGATV